MTAQIIETRPDEGGVHFHGLGMETACSAVHTGQLWQRVGESGERNRVLYGVSARVLWNARRVVRENAAHEVKHWGTDRGTLRVWESELLNYPNGAAETSGIIRAGVRVK